MPFDKLYLKLKCNVCNGTRIFNHGHHDPHEPHKWKTCPYCDPNGHVVIAATPELIVKYIKQLPEENREEILKQLRLTPEAS